MVYDALRQVFQDDDLTVATNSFVQNGADVNLGRGGLNSKSELAVHVGLAEADRDLSFNLYLSLNNDTFRQIATVTFPAGHAGKRIAYIGRSRPWKEYDDTEIMIRCSVTATDHANAGDWDNVSAYLGCGEEEVFGREPNAADAIVDA